MAERLFIFCRSSLDLRAPTLLLRNPTMEKELNLEPPLKLRRHADGASVSFSEEDDLPIPMLTAFDRD